MYTKYIYNTGATQADILADIVAVLTGETDKNNLSASCNKTNTTITSIIPAGWTVHDASAGTNMKCLKAVISDDGATYKYIVIDLSNSGYILSKGYETWNATNHTGTNLCYYSDQTTSGQRWTNGGAGTLYIFSSVRFIYIWSEYSTTYGSSWASSGTGLFERTRAIPIDTVAYGLPKWFLSAGTFGYDLFNNGNNSFVPRIINKSKTELTTSNAYVIPTPIPYTTTIDGASMLVPGASADYVPFFPIYVNGQRQGYPAGPMPAAWGEISSLCDVWVVPRTTCNHLDTVSKGDENYIVMRAWKATPDGLIALRSE